MRQEREKPKLALSSGRTCTLGRDHLLRKGVLAKRRLEALVCRYYCHITCALSAWRPSHPLVIMWGFVLLTYEYEPSRILSGRKTPRKASRVVYITEVGGVGFEQPRGSGQINREGAGIFNGFITADAWAELAKRPGARAPGADGAVAA